MLDKLNTSFNYAHVISLLEANTPAHGGEEHEFSTYVERRSTSQKKKPASSVYSKTVSFRDATVSLSLHLVARGSGNNILRKIWCWHHSAESQQRDLASEDINGFGLVLGVYIAVRFSWLYDGGGS